MSRYIITHKGVEFKNVEITLYCDAGISSIFNLDETITIQDTSFYTTQEIKVQELFPYYEDEPLYLIVGDMVIRMLTIKVSFENSGIIYAFTIAGNHNIKEVNVNNIVTKTEAIRLFPEEFI